MYKVVECFSGIGSQVQAMKNLDIEHEIVATVEWDINAVCAYDVLHNNDFDLTKYSNMSKGRLIEKLKVLNLSTDGKAPMTLKSMQKLSEEALKRICLSIERNNNLVNIGNVTAKDLSSDIDLLTYSFPCQDLSICGFWHGNTSGIKRNADNRSGLLWEIERILSEMMESNKSLPRILLMENVTNILSNAHKNDFSEWTDYLSEMGYYNHIYRLNAMDFGMPQNRERVYMISVLCEKNQHELLDGFFRKYNLENKEYVSGLIKNYSLEELLRKDYHNETYKKEADESQPNFTPSRRKIFTESKILADDSGIKQNSVTTITTKQDRYPNSGLIGYCSQDSNKAPYRNLTGRECFLLMGFAEEQFDKLLRFNFHSNKRNMFFTNSKFIKMAGNSIVVQVIEQVFKQVLEIDKMINSKNEVNTKKAV